MRRVVITGMGMVSPLGCGVETSWRRLINAESGIDAITSFDVSDLPAKIAGQIDEGEGEGLFNVDDFITPKERRRVDDFIVYGMAAAQEAVEDSGWKPESDDDKFSTGVLIGSGIGGLPEISRGAITVDCESGGGVRRLSPFFIPASLINLISGQVSIKYGFKGPNHAVVTACSTGAHAIGDAARLIMWEDADVMVAGGAEAACCRVGMAGFSQSKALSTSYNDRPQAGSRPWDRGRDGFVMGEGAGVVVLEELEHAKARGAKIYAEVIGYGLTGDAHHITAPTPDGDGAFRCMTAAMKRAELNPEDIDYVNAHGTSTMADVIELAAVKRAFGNAVNDISMSSTKSAIGHLLGAAGAVESIFSILAINNSVAPPTLNLEDPDEGCDIDLVPLQPREREIRAALSNSFGFGGTNATLVFKKFS
ncbi:MAG: beta-ketoacyl-ACP synthase II [Rhodospirillaceae bacterium]|jgi:3-oxoacyl-[acyl-carrier-protein] synthase II|nr:beta-ketoacyl-ACP synthase II [Rhodospirillaceae bacterium]MBT4220402.1 beta-ketoacyl-ACP synthase II [Rhodospirillaceae bacterium]MBT4464813.1 beta-ketoacyl-ACP synthase II [Rhodospirillaceae bacterium]MBT5012971.1 beta-ketoacyl-ACP synthase II [Rhodospirillaceae bacterium]MBT7356074.1 beta-ketoacyl-ACP synthase II [Rhodospirillaceae bacterium]